MIVHLPLTKTGVRKGFSESVCVDDQYLVKAVHRLLHSVDDHKLFCTFTYAKLNQWFHDSLQAYGLEHLQLKLHSVRRGGATENFRLFRSLDKTVILGRWKDVSTAKIYLNEGLQQLLAHHISLASLSLIDSDANSLLSLF